MRVLFEVEFDSEAWAAMGADQRSEWIDAVADAINAEAYVQGVDATPETLKGFAP